MAKYDIRFVLRQAFSFIRQSGWAPTCSFTDNRKACIAATFDPKCSRISSAAKLVKELKILLAYPPFDIRYSILHDGSLYITIDKPLTPSLPLTTICPGDPRQDNFNFSTPNRTRRKINAPSANHP